MSTYRRRLLTNQALRVAKGDLIYPNLVAAWSAKGKTNEDEDRNILKDLTGHGHDITLNNMAFNNQESGYGGYRNYAQGSENEVKVTSVDYKDNATIRLGYKVIGLKKGDIITVSVDCEAYNINFESNSKISMQFNATYSYAGLNRDIIENGNVHIKRKILLNNHYNSSDPVTEEDDGAPYVRFDYITFNEGGYFLVKNFTVVKGEEEVEWFKDYQYPNALVFDGVDDYGVCENIPILNDFTVIAKREYFNGEGGVIQKGGNSSGTSVFIMEGGSSKNTIWSYGIGTATIYPDNIISYMTPTNYNLLKIYRGHNIDITKIITLAIIRKSDLRHWSGAFYSAYLFNKSLEESEIKSFIRKYIDSEYLLPSEIPTPDCYYDFSLGSNEDENPEIIKDLSGNGNDAKAYNFAWSGMSGYGGYGTDFNNWANSSDGECQVINSTQIIWNRNSKEVWTFCRNLDTLNLYKFKIKGNNSFEVKYDGKYIKEGASIQTTLNIITEVINANEEAEIILPKFDNYPEGVTISPSLLYFNVSIGVPTTIEILPEYPGALVLDGTDDYISLDTFDSGFKTIFMVCEWFKTFKLLYDLRLINLDFAIYTGTHDNIGVSNCAYYSRANNLNKTYINGTYNDLNSGMIYSFLLNKKHVITITSTSDISRSPIIGANLDHNNNFANMAIYKFLGFKEKLTDDLILYVIKKYNLLDGIDDLSVIDEISNDTLISNETLIQN